MRKKLSLTNIADLRTKKLPEYRSFKLSKKIQPDYVKSLPNMRALWIDTWQFLWKYRSKMILFALVYMAAYLVLVKGVNGFALNTADLRDNLKLAFHGNLGAAASSMSLYISLMSSVTASTTEVSNYYQVTILVVFSLAFIWLIRKLHGRRSTATVKDSFYVGMRPLIPFIGVVIILTLELAPAGLGGLLLATAQSAIVQSGTGEIMAFSVVMILCLVLTGYLLAGSIFAIYIVTLPSATPLIAIKSSMRLLRIHRWVVVRKMAAFYVSLILLGFVLVIPFVFWLPARADVAFFVLSSASFAVMHTFMYKLYRSML